MKQRGAGGITGENDIDGITPVDRPLRLSVTLAAEHLAQVTAVREDAGPDRLEASASTS